MTMMISCLFLFLCVLPTSVAFQQHQFRRIIFQQNPSKISSKANAILTNGNIRQLHAMHRSDDDPRLTPQNLLDDSEANLRQIGSKSTSNILQQHSEPVEDAQTMDRRWFLGTAMMVGSAGILAAPNWSAVASAMEESSTVAGAAAPPSDQLGGVGGSKLRYVTTPINKRTGITVFDAEKAGYNVRFVTYLSRFLLVFDADCQTWWYSRAQDIPRRASADEVAAIRLAQFGAFSASVEVGLQEFEGSEGPSTLMESLLNRYCPDIEVVKEKRIKRGLPSLTEPQEGKELREIKEARRQIALLFGLMESNQPVERITQLLAAIANGCITSVRLDDGGSGYAPGYGPPLVVFPPPEAGLDYSTAKGRAILRPSGKILRIDLENRGFGYQKAPTVTITPPGAEKGVIVPGTRAATAKAFLFKNGVNKGRIERIQLVDAGEGYLEGERSRVLLDKPELLGEKGGLRATAKAILELEVAGIEIVDGGSGYAVEKPLQVYIDPPPLTARVNMNDPLTARIIDPSKLLPTTTIPNVQQRKKMPDPSDPESFTAMMDKLAKNDGKGGGGGCIGRACYDRTVVAYATAQAETSSFNTFRFDADASLPIEKERMTINEIRLISAASGGSDSQQPVFYSGSSTSSSAQLLTLLPAGFGLEYDEKDHRFVLSVGQDVLDVNGAMAGALKVPLDPEFGPRGRSPIERDVTLDFPNFLRFCASGAVCACGSHFLLTPLDVVKTKIQTDPENYPGIVSALQKVTNEGGLGGFFVGWVPTTIGFFLWGGFSYSVTELLRRYFNELLGAQAASLEVPVIVVAAAISSFFSVFILCPFEAVRVRSVAQPGYGKNIVDTTSRIVKEEGIGSLFSAVPPFILKEIPFGVAKFFVFTLSTRFLFQTFPAAQEDIQLSLLVSLGSGMMGGLAAAIVSNPADATISEMKKAKTNMGPVVAFQTLVDRGGYANLMRGLPIRMVFYPLITSMQFFVFDVVRLYLGVGADDLKVYLDVLGGALKEGGTTIGPV